MPRPLVYVSLAFTLVLCACGTDRVSPPASTPAYVGRSACAGCHADEAAAWTGSDHDLAMAPATEADVLGDFDDAVFASHGVETRFFRQGAGFFVRTEGPLGEVDTFRVAYTFGARPLQQYLVAFPDGRLQALDVAWDVERKRWYSLRPDERIPPGDALHWTGRAMNWNHMCATCHSTGLEKNFDVATGAYQTTWSEIDVSCEACHGPGEAHVQWAEGGERSSDNGLTASLRTARLEVDTCAPCHARRRTVAADFVPGNAFLDHYSVELLDADALYFADGQIRDEVFEYGSFLQSKMYRLGVRCSDCHDPHSARLRLEGNALCTQCHAAPTFDAFTHHRHPEGSPGAACVSCHMPERTYMGIDARRDHRFGVPRPDLTVDLGVPNACNGCHTDRPATWARDRVAEWHGPDRPDDAGYARVVAAGRRGEPAAAGTLAALARNADLPPIQRASALALLAAYDSEVVGPTLRQALVDGEPLVRLAAVRGFEQQPDDALYPALAPVLNDSLRAVRVEAARVLARVAPRAFAADADAAAAFRAAVAEYRAGLAVDADQPEAHLNLAVLHERLGEPREAEAAYRTALRLDSAFAPAHVNLAMLYNEQRAVNTGSAPDLRRLAEHHLRAALRSERDLAEAQYALGLLLAENTTQLARAVEHLERAARLRPGDARIQYNTGLAHQHLGRTAAAETFLRAAHRLEPQHPDYLYALSVFYGQQQRWKDALAFTDALLHLRPDAAALHRQRSLILQQIQAREAGVSH